MIRLKPCPFCGKENPTLIHDPGKNGWRDRWYVVCYYDNGGCGAASGFYHYPTEAINNWNKRRRTYGPERWYSDNE